MAYVHAKVPAAGRKIEVKDGKLQVPDQPIVPFIEGDGTGPDIWRASVRVFDAAVHRAYGGRRKIQWMEVYAGQKAFDKLSSWLPDETVEAFREFLVGIKGPLTTPIGGGIRSLNVALRQLLDLYVCLRPVRWFKGVPSPVLHPEKVDMVIFRENTEGAYVNVGGNFKKGTPDEIAIQDEIHTRKGVERIIRAAFEYAVAHGRREVLMADKSNVMRYGHDLWQRAFAEIAAEFPQIASRHMFVDALTMQMVKNPGSLDVIVTNNMFGDIITDLGAALQGGLGVAGSANLHPGQTSMFEPVHGSAPKYAGTGRANPVGAILSASLMLDYLGHAEAAKTIEDAVARSMREGQSTPDLGGSLTTSQVGDLLARAIGQGVAA
jgi:isocitrate dehydrogenase